jgi:RimJ/RimL family protein N-acetyltransferase
VSGRHVALVFIAMNADGRGAESTPANVSLRRPTSADGVALARLWLDPRVMEFLGGVREREQAARAVDAFVDHWEVHGFGMYVVEVDGLNDPVGVCGLNVLEDEPGHPIELNYALHPSAWGRGIATRAAQTVLSNDARRLSVDEVVAITQEANRPSQRVLERLGFDHQQSITRWDAPQRWYVLSLTQRRSP